MMLADNRDVIADILEGLAEALPWHSMFVLEGKTRARLMRGADTLRWSAALDATPTGEELAELERLREFADAVDDALSHTTRHPGTQVKAIRAALKVLT